MFFSLERRPEVKAVNPDFGVGKLAQCLAERWKVMDSSQKSTYEQMARRDKERYEQELKAYKRGLYKGTGLTARQVAHSVTGRIIPPPASTLNHRNNTSHTDSHATAGVLIAPPSAAPDPSPVAAMVHVGNVSNPLGSDEDEGSPSGDELDQLCEFYQ